MTQARATFTLNPHASSRSQKYTNQIKGLLKMQLNSSPDLIRLPVDTHGFH